jgi:hypothetical protein
MLILSRERAARSCSHASPSSCVTLNGTEQIAKVAPFAIDSEARVRKSAAGDFAK